MWACLHHQRSSCLEEEALQMPLHHLLCALVKYQNVETPKHQHQHQHKHKHKHQHLIIPSIFSGICGLDLTVLSLRTISQVGLAPPLHLFPHVSNACIQFDQTFRSFPSSLSSMSFSSFSASLPSAFPLPWQFT